MNPVDFLYESYNVDRNTTSPIKLEISRWGSLPRIFRRLGYKVGAEIGISSGIFSKYLCKGNPDLRLYSIDAWQIYPGYTYAHSQKKMDKLYSIAKKRLIPYKCNIVRGWSVDIAKRFANESLDFVYIDANHDYEHVKEDIKEWSKKVRKGGIISGHDYINGSNGVAYGVKQAVNEWTVENKIHPLWVLNKNSQISESPSWMYVK